MKLHYYRWDSDDRMPDKPRADLKLTAFCGLRLYGKHQTFHADEVTCKNCINEMVLWEGFKPCS